MTQTEKEKEFRDACHYGGDIETVKKYIDEGSVNINSLTSDSWTPLMLASFDNQIEIVKLLIAHGANVNSTDTLGRTVVMCANDNRHAQIVKLLIDNGADINIKDKRGATALILAVRDNQSEMVELLLENDAKLFREDIEKTLDKITRICSDPEEKNKKIIDFLNEMEEKKLNQQIVKLDSDDSIFSM